MNIEFNLRKKTPEIEEIENNYDSNIKPVSANKEKSKFRRGKLVLCFIFSPETSRGEFKNLLQEEMILTDKLENQKFLIVEKPAMEVLYKNKNYNVYVCDACKGVTVSLEFCRDQKLANVYCDSHMISNILDISFLSKASNIKPDWKQLVGIALFGLSFGFLFGLCF